MSDRRLPTVTEAAAACGIFGAGVMAGIYNANRKEGRIGLLKTATTGPFSPVRHAGKALAMGTALCLGVSGLAAIAVGEAFGVHSVYDAADRLKAWAPQKRRQLEKWLNVEPNTALEEERQKLATMSYDQEVTHWMQVLSVESTRGGRS